MEEEEEEECSGVADCVNGRISVANNTPTAIAPMITSPAMAQASIRKGLDKGVGVVGSGGGAVVVSSGGAGAVLVNKGVCDDGGCTEPRGTTADVDVRAFTRRLILARCISFVFIRIQERTAMYHGKGWFAFCFGLQVATINVEPGFQFAQTHNVNRCQHTIQNIPFFTHHSLSSTSISSSFFSSACSSAFAEISNPASITCCLMYPVTLILPMGSH